MGSVISNIDDKIEEFGSWENYQNSLKTILAPADLIKKVEYVLKGHRFDLHNEKALQAHMETALKESGLTVSREVRLNSKSIIDFLVGEPGCRVGIEVKIKGSPMAIYRQCARYTDHEWIDGIILATNRTIHMPETINNKPTRIINLGKAWL